MLGTTATVTVTCSLSTICGVASFPEIRVRTSAGTVLAS